MPGLRYFNELAANLSQKCPACPGGRPVRAQPGGTARVHSSVALRRRAFFLAPQRQKRGGVEATAATPMPSPLPTEGGVPYAPDPIKRTMFMRARGAAARRDPCPNDDS